jgi:hypothetical protein
MAGKWDFYFCLLLQSQKNLPNIKLSRRDVCQDCSKSCLNPALVVPLNPRLVGELLDVKYGLCRSPAESSGLS